MSVNVSDKKSLWKEMQGSSYMSGGNAAYLEDLYEQYLQDPQELQPIWREFFKKLAGEPGQDISYQAIRQYFKKQAQKSVKPGIVISEESEHVRQQGSVDRLIDAYRFFGYMHAQLDPLSLTPKPELPVLNTGFYGLSTEPQEKFQLNGFFPIKQASLSEVCAVLQRTYCGSLGIEYKYITDSHQVEWLQQRIESTEAHPIFSPQEKRRILLRLIEAEGLERYLGAKFVGQTRFSLEGGDSLMPLLDKIIQRSGEYDIKELIIGMGHRGRLNVLVNALGKSPGDLCLEFEGKHKEEGSGDVKYHMGFSSDVATETGAVHLVLAFNPSHLEIIDPVVQGSVRCRQERRDDQGHDQVIPILIHGDAAFIGQGVVMETFSLSQTPGYTTGGTIHIVVNNQIGFTTSDPVQSRSSRYCTDIAKMVEAPVLHINGDDPEAVVFAAQIALDYRMRFKRDIVLDLVCYRRHGHNEGDEPSATQPEMYRVVKTKSTTSQIYVDRLIAEGYVTESEVEAMIHEYRNKLDSGQEIVPAKNGKSHDQYAVDWKSYRNQEWTAPAKTQISLNQLKKLAQAIETLPADFVLQPQVAKMMEDRRKMTAGALPLNWGYAETLAYASLLHQGYSIRISGEDSQRGTFAHRHAVLHDYKNHRLYIPLEQVAEKGGRISIIDSVLSEEAVLGFEYGYASADPQALVIWEAQYGDFANGAQVVIDQFISSGEQKWGRLCGLVMLLPHGYEGAGPEHSSARLERYLQLCAEHNMQVCVPTTPAQIFHMLRRQILRPYRKPLVVMTPKSLLRHKLATSSLQELTQGEFQVVIPEIEDIKPAQVTRIVLCSGKVYYDLLEQRREQQQNNIALIRIEQLYPFPEEQLIAELERYKKAKEIVWCQEEPKNQGAWYSTYHHLVACLAQGQTLSYVGREASASPAVGSKSLHVEQQTALIKQALTLGY